MGGGRRAHEGTLGRAGAPADDVPAWRLFEQAVAAFLTALAPHARVVADARTPDQQTGRKRQRDVWIEVPFGGLFTLRILVSCKHKKAKLNEQDLDAFHGEFLNSGANKGVIYALSGFSAPALEKARKLGITCCGLYVNRPPDLPAQLPFHAYAYREQLKLDVGADPLPTRGEIAELLEVPVALEADAGPFVELLSARFLREREATRVAAPIGHPVTALIGLELDAPRDGRRLQVLLSSRWAVYRADMSAWLLNGTYAFTEGTFAGSLSTPWMDQANPHPGPGWVPVPAGEIDETVPRLISLSFGGDPASDLRAAYTGAVVGELAIADQVRPSSGRVSVLSRLGAQP